MVGDFMGVEESDNSRKGFVMIDNVCKISHTFFAFVFRDSINSRVGRNGGIDDIELIIPTKRDQDISCSKTQIKGICNQ